MQSYKLALSLAFCLMPILIFSQSLSRNDNTYYERFPDKLTARVYLSQKYVHVNFPSQENGVSQLEYKANTNLHLGAGISYRWISLSASYGFNFLNHDGDKGQTKGLDLQLHLYPYKWAIDIQAVFPKGFYIDPKGYGAADKSRYYYRPDIQMNNTGIAAYYIQNHRKYSCKAAFSQTEWQKKSAGSFLYGGEFFRGSLNGDSALVPAILQDKYPEKDIHRINYIRVGPGVGYAHTFVAGQHFFASGSMVGNLDLTYTTEKGITTKNKLAVSPAIVFKAGVGYNSGDWNISTIWTGYGLWLKGAASPEKYYWPAGNIRAIIAKRFSVAGKHHHS